MEPFTAFLEAIQITGHRNIDYASPKHISETASFQRDLKEVERQRKGPDK
jgi:hypothetical protein